MGKLFSIFFLSRRILLSESFLLLLSGCFLNLFALKYQVYRYRCRFPCIGHGYHNDLEYLFECTDCHWYVLRLHFVHCKDSSENIQPLFTTTSIHTTFLSFESYVFWLQTKDTSQDVAYVIGGRDPITFQWNITVFRALTATESKDLSISLTKSNRITIALGVDDTIAFHKSVST